MNIIQEEEDKVDIKEELKSPGKRSPGLTLNRLSEELPKEFTKAKDENKNVGDEIENMLAKMD